MKCSPNTGPTQKAAKTKVNYPEKQKKRLRSNTDNNAHVHKMLLQR